MYTCISLSLDVCMYIYIYTHTRNVADQPGRPGVSQALPGAPQQADKRQPWPPIGTTIIIIIIITVITIILIIIIITIITIITIIYIGTG